jgi:hypothetical protein
VYTTWDISFHELERRASLSSPDSESYRVAILILQLFSFFHFDGIPEGMFRRAAETTGPYLDPVKPDNRLASLLQQTNDDKWDSFPFRAGVRVLTQFTAFHGHIIQLGLPHRGSV